MTAPEQASQREAPLARGTVIVDHLLEPLPIWWGVFPPAIAAVAQGWIGQGVAKRPDARHITGQKTLAQGLVVVGLDAEDEEQVFVGIGWRPEEVNQRLPPAVQSILEHLTLRRTA